MSRLRFRLLVLVACLPACLRIHPAIAAEKVALVVGVDRYLETELSSLDFADDDALGLGAALTSLGFDVVTMTGGDERVSLHPDTPADILGALDRRLRFVQRDDTVVVALSGHGVQLNGDVPGPDGAQEFWFCPAKARLDDRATLIPISTVIKRMAGCPAARKALLVDACRSDMRPPGAARDRELIPRELDPAAPARRLIPDGMVALFSCSPRERSFERKDLGHGLFSYHAIQYLSGKADDPARFYDGGEASLTELVTYVQKRTSRSAEKLLSAFQTPELVGRMTDWSFGKIDGSLAGANRTHAMPGRGPGPGDIEVNSLGMKLVLIPVQDFEMGSNDTPALLKAAGFTLPGGDYDTSDERPVHPVRITKPFRMGQTEVTVGEFRAFYDDGYQGKLDCEKDGKGGFGYDARNSNEPFAQKPEYRPWSWGHPGMNRPGEAGRTAAGRYPVVNVSWNDAVAFCEWLSKKEKRRYRLPTEAEWEYACRAGTTTGFWTGDDPESLAAHENIADASLSDELRGLSYAIRGRDGHSLTAPVGSFSPGNLFGLHDMHGNVGEWCGDWYDEGYYATLSKTSAIPDPKGPSSPSLRRVIRGGNWGRRAVLCRSAYRQGAPPTERSHSVGFRVVCELD